MMELLQQATPSVVDERAGEVAGGGLATARSPLLYVGPAVRTVAAAAHIRN